MTFSGYPKHHMFANGLWLLRLAGIIIDCKTNHRHSMVCEVLCGVRIYVFITPRPSFLAADWLRGRAIFSYISLYISRRSFGSNKLRSPPTGSRSCNLLCRRRALYPFPYGGPPFSEEGMNGYFSPALRCSAATKIISPTSGRELTTRQSDAALANRSPTPPLLHNKECTV